ncbi:hypothetical protein [Pantoea sp. B65]|uniref:hypothetical protein n=1 Tax=Pantoea sp. B65 TaxID=2813359 RepID=UPI0039B3E47E
MLLRDPFAPPRTLRELPAEIESNLCWFDDKVIHKFIPSVHILHTSDSLVKILAMTQKGQLRSASSAAHSLAAEEDYNKKRCRGLLGRKST